MSLAAFGIIVLGVLLGMHALPGFHNWLVLDKVVLSSGAEPYTLYLNFDKTLVGIFILGLCNPERLTGTASWRRALRTAAPVALILLLGVALSALALRYLTWQPKWTPLFWIWAANNLLFTCLSEEAFFRGFIQQELASTLRDVRHGAAVAIAASAVLFGLAHFAGGASYVMLAAVAGLGYAIVYHRTVSIEMSMLTHFTLNAMHFLLFTYPRAA
jgi:membrane protease YdiL (CAAX protease family)